MANTSSLNVFLSNGTGGWAYVRDVNWAGYERSKWGYRIDSGFGEVFETPEIVSVRDEIDFNVNKNKNLASELVQIQKYIKQKNKECIDGSRNICAGRKILDSSSAGEFILTSGKKVSRMEYKEMICRACLEVELRLNQIKMHRERISRINCEIRCNNREIESLREELRLRAVFPFLLSEKPFSVEYLEVFDISGSDGEWRKAEVYVYLEQLFGDERVVFILTCENKEDVQDIRDNLSGCETWGS